MMAIFLLQAMKRLNKQKRADHRRDEISPAVDGRKIWFELISVNGVPAFANANLSHPTNRTRCCKV